LKENYKKRKKEEKKNFGKEGWFSSRNWMLVKIDYLII